MRLQKGRPRKLSASSRSHSATPCRHSPTANRCPCVDRRCPLMLTSTTAPLRTPPLSARARRGCGALHIACEWPPPSRLSAGTPLGRSARAGVGPRRLRRGFVSSLAQPRLPPRRRPQSARVPPRGPASDGSILRLDGDAGRARSPRDRSGRGPSAALRSDSARPTCVAAARSAAGASGRGKVAVGARASAAARVLAT